MRLLAYILLAYVALALQLGMGRHITWQGVQPNLVLLAAVFIGVNAPRDAALLGCFVMGLMQDLLTAQPLGTYAFAYGLSALFVSNARGMVYRDHPLTHLSLVLFAGFVTLLVILVGGWIHPAAPAMKDGESTIPAARVAFGTEFRRMIYTALLAPFILWGLGRIRKTFAFQGSYRGSGR